MRVHFFMTYFFTKTFPTWENWYLGGLLLQIKQNTDIVRLSTMGKGGQKMPKILNHSLWMTPIISLIEPITLISLPITNVSLSLCNHTKLDNLRFLVIVFWLISNIKRSVWDANFELFQWKEVHFQTKNKLEKCIL